MKVTINIDCSPEEARNFMGLPDAAGAQKEIVEAWQTQAMEAMSGMDPAALFSAWIPGGELAGGTPSGNDSWDQMQKAFCAAMSNADGSTKS